MPFLTNDPLPQCLQLSPLTPLLLARGHQRGSRRYLSNVKCLRDVALHAGLRRLTAQAGPAPQLSSAKVIKLTVPLVECAAPAHRMPTHQACTLGIAQRERFVVRPDIAELERWIVALVVAANHQPCLRKLTLPSSAIVQSGFHATSQAWPSGSAKYPE